MIVGSVPPALAELRPKGFLIMRRKIASLLLAALLGLFGTACASGDGAEDTATDAASEATSEAEEETSEAGSEMSEEESEEMSEEESEEASESES